MKYAGTITRVQRSRTGVTLIVETEMGLRGIELDRDEWAAIRADFEVSEDEAVVGWSVEYDPAHGDLEIIGPGDDEPDDAEDDAPTV